MLRLCRGRLIILLICLLYFALLGGVIQNINVMGGVQGHENIIFSDDFIGWIFKFEVISGER